MRAIRRLVVLQPHGLGDMLMTTPMLGGIRRSYPEVKVTVVCSSPAAAALVAGMPLGAEALVFDPSRSPLKNLGTLVLKLRRFRPDAFLVTPWMTPWKGELLARLSGAPLRVGAQSWWPIGGYTHVVPRAQAVHKVEGHLEMARELFPDLKETPLIFPVPPEARAEARRFWRRFGFEGRPVLGVHPGGDHRNPNKIYPLENYLKVIEGFLAAHPEAGCLIFLGPSEEGLQKRIPQSSSRIQVTVRQRLPVTAALLGQVRVLLHSDTGLGHLAAAVKTPVVSIFGPGNPDISEPRGELTRVVTLTPRLPCQPCVYTRRYPKCRYNACLKDLAPDLVLSAIMEMWRLATHTSDLIPEGSKACTCH